MQLCQINFSVNIHQQGRPLWPSGRSKRPNRKTYYLPYRQADDHKGRPCCWMPPKTLIGQLRIFIKKKIIYFEILKEKIRKFDKCNNQSIFYIPSSVLNVVVFQSPVSTPLFNQYIRWAEVPCVNHSVLVVKERSAANGSVCL